jgi:hypothetical protein
MNAFQYFRYDDGAAFATPIDYRWAEFSSPLAYNCDGSILTFSLPDGGSPRKYSITWRTDEEFKAQNLDAGISGIVETWVYKRRPGPLPAPPLGRPDLAPKVIPAPELGRPGGPAPEDKPAPPLGRPGR